MATSSVHALHAPPTPVVASDFDHDLFQDIADALVGTIDFGVHYDRSPHDGCQYLVPDDVDQRVTLDLTEAGHIPVEMDGETEIDGVLRVYRFLWWARIHSVRRDGDARVLAIYRVQVKLA